MKEHSTYVSEQAQFAFANIDVYYTNKVVFFKKTRVSNFQIKKPKHILSVILKAKKLLKRFTEKNCKKQIKKVYS